MFALCADSPIGIKEREVLKSLYDRGYRFALENVRPDPEMATKYATVFPYIDYIKFDVTATDMDLLPESLEGVKGKKLMAERIEIEEVYDAYKALGFDYFQGYHFEQPTLIGHNRIDPKYLGVVKIYNMLLSGTPIEQIAKERNNFV